MEISLREILEMYESSAMPIEEIVASFFLDSKTIVHCINNNTDYHINEVDSLVAYVKSKLK